jgi:UDPglucose--hexose-1-phosphate uridylyltransferase
VRPAGFKIWTKLAIVVREAMAQLRYDPTMGDWIAFSTARADRPHEEPVDADPAPSAEPRRDPACPFCPGNEHATRSTIDLEPDPAQPERWLVRVFSNKYPALSPDVPPERSVPAGIFREMPGYGRHEVIVESPDHGTALADQPLDQVTRVLGVLRRRASVLAREPQLEFVQVFKNHGARAGSSLPHPHFQILATPVVPRQIRLRYQLAAEFYNEHGVSVYDELCRSELDAKVRVISSSPEFVAFNPFASRMPYETWIVPRNPAPTFEAVDPRALPELARVLSDVLRRLRKVLDDPPFNLMILSAPRRHADEPDFVWHIEILPRLGTAAGFELSTGMAINSVFPETAAEALRGA